MLFLLSNIVITSPNNYYLNIRLRKLTSRCLCSQQLKEPFHRLWILPTSQINYLQTKDESFSCPINTHRNHKKKRYQYYSISLFCFSAYINKREKEIPFHLFTQKGIFFLHISYLVSNLATCLFNHSTSFFIS